MVSEVAKRNVDAGAVAPRRRFLAACGCTAMFAGFGVAPRARAAGGPHTTLDADHALAALMEGNANFVEGNRGTPLIDRARRLALAQGQAPFAVLIGCSDSRVPPELLFGRGLGDLFIVRVAGNTLDRSGLGSVEYGVAELGCPLVMVLGHERCGAVQAAVKVVTEDAHFPGAIGEMVAPIIPAVLAAQRMPGDLVANAVKENVRRVARRLRETDDVLSDPVAEGKVRVVGAYYHLDDGRVELLG
ncbi:carbonic anhydrase [Chitinasiproducens palmae]|uniref:carbonic anhydrase n=1 Tax=Chitinasiproducens palmae TaxID=1770053 RepID=A0A1H2PNW1_9BURK|nr:carbonic anhydrase [Chitinasiproducens palmae]SDV48408.1 carbonic anhydrase [Chitinasiproducens palmae]